MGGWPTLTRMRVPHPSSAWVGRKELHPASGQRVSEWNASTHAQLKGHYYWGSKPVGFYTYNGPAHFQHQDWLGTERMRTTYNGGVEGSFTSLPFGDGLATVSGSDTDANHYATLDHDTESDTEHAEFRQYSSAQGRWLAPDPYDGSYDPSNPQSFNRYVYVLDSPLAFLDPLGLDMQFACSSIDTADPDPDDDGSVGVTSTTNFSFWGVGNFDPANPVTASIPAPYNPGAPSNGRKVNGGYPPQPGAKERQCAGIATANKMLGLTATGMAATAGGFGIAALVTVEAPPVSAGLALIGAVDGLSALVVGGAGQALDLYGNVVVGCN